MLKLEAFAPDDARLLQEGVDRWAADAASVEHIHDALREDVDHARAKWRALAELGWLAIGLPEEVGGLGAGDAKDIAIISAGFGRSVRNEPLLSAVVICARLLAILGDESQKAELAAIIAGNRTAAFAHTEPELGFASGPLRTRCSHGALHGSKSFVLDGADADFFLVSAMDDDGAMGIYLVQRDAPGLEIVPFQMIDGRRSADLRLSGVEALRLGSQDAREAIDYVLDFAIVALAADAAGAMAGIIELTKEYMASRHQFGKPLNAFQVLRHRLVDMYVHLEETKAMIDMGATALALPDPAERSVAIAALKVQMCRAARFVGQQGVQLHGGMGMTDEYIVSHYFKRLMVLEAFLGNADFHLRRVERAITR
ncbi:acyl-CoA dehydrogenase family protein [Rhizorhabdus dicambivorans]|nr:acyl-CoA dehydrogenase family protein [Rhizorhabdus dicambivorans]